MKTASKNPTRTITSCFLITITILFGLFLLAFALRETPGYFLILFITGWLSWTFVEYFVHRFLMHELIVPGKKDTLFNHHEHHQHPEKIKVSFFQRALFLTIGVAVFWKAYELNNLFTVFAGFFTGFISYNFLHFLLHQPYGKYFLPRIQKAHILHHSRYPNCGYSFSTILWDWMYDTLPPKNAELTEEMKLRFFKEPSKSQPLT